MIVIRGTVVADPQGYSKPYIEVIQTADGYTVHKRNSSSGPSITVVPSDIQPWGRKFFYWGHFGDGFVSPPHYDGSRDAESFLKSRFGVAELDFAVARGGNNELVIVTFTPTAATAPYSQYSQHGSTIDVVASVLPGYGTTQQVAAVKAKRNLLLHVNPMDILAEQEKQLDLLSALVFDLVQRLPEADRPAWFASFKSVVEQHSAVQFKGAAGCISDIQARKSSVRSLQSYYFAERGDTNA